MRCPTELLATMSAPRDRGSDVLIQFDGGRDTLDSRFGSLNSEVDTSQGQGDDYSHPLNSTWDDGAPGPSVSLGCGHPPLSYVPHHARFLCLGAVRCGLGASCSRVFLCCHASCLWGCAVC